jgi:CheY-like chemotaxis protein
MAGTIVALVPDLMFGVRIEDAAKRAGARVEFFEDLEDAAMRLASVQPDVLIVDMSHRSFNLEAVAELSRLNGVPVVAFGPHVDLESRQAAIRAGIQQVLTRNKFVQDLPEIINTYVGRSRPGSA